MAVYDYCNYNSSGVVLHVGGNYNQNLNHGLFYLNGNNAATNKNANVGSRILYGIHKFWAITLRLAEDCPGINFAHLLVEIDSNMIGLVLFYYEA